MDSDIYAITEKTQVAAPVVAPQTESKTVEEPAPIIPVVEKVEAPPQKIAYNYLGENNKYLLVLLNDPAYEFCSPKTLEALTNMLKPKKLELKDIALVNLAKHADVTFQSLKDYFACSKMVLFGINPAEVGIKRITSNQISPFEGVKVLASYSFAEMEEDVAKKRTFWTEMKVL
jgi:hypothetical protein